MGKIRHVIIGNSAAALNAVKAIRCCDTSCLVTVISAENSLAYSPVLLPYYLSGKINRDGLFIVNKDFYKRNAVELKLGKEVIYIDTINQSVLLRDESTVEYDNLLIASGASPDRLNTASGPLTKVMTLRTIDDAQRILEASKSASDILISGAGLASLEVASALTKPGKKVTVVAKSKQILSRNTDAECASIIQKEIEKSGVRFLLGRDVTEIAPFKHRLRVLTDLDDSITVDMVIVGKGVSPNVQFLMDQRIKVDRGILVNGLMKTNLDNVYAAGDVAQSKSLLTHDYQIFANWPSACFEGEIAGLNMAGQRTELPGEIAYNVLPIFNRTVAFLGESERIANSTSVEVLRYYDDKKGVYRKFLVKENRIIGAVLLQSFQDVGIVLNLMIKGTDVSPRKHELARNPISWGKIIHDIVC